MGTISVAFGVGDSPGADAPYPPAGAASVAVQEAPAINDAQANV
jgi:hypothetical protein